MITLVHGGQSGVDRGAHEAAIDNGWPVAGYMPQDGRDERGPIPIEVSRYLWPCDRPGFGARTEANVRSCHGLLVIVPDEADPRATPGTAKTIDLVTRLYKRRMIVDPTCSAGKIAEWIWRDLLALSPLPLPLGFVPAPTRLMVAGPRESKWDDARIVSAGLLRRVGTELQEIAAGRTAGRVSA